MFFRSYTGIVEYRALAPFVHQLSDEEIAQTNFGIEHIGAVVDIKIKKKEDTLMVEKLKAYLAELEAKKAAVEAEDNAAEIEAKTAEFKANLEKEYAEKKAAIVAKVNSDIECVNNIIVREEAIAETVVVEPSITE